jgi:GTPase Era involved in 16S rRNA processing
LYEVKKMRKSEKPVSKFAFQIQLVPLRLGVKVKEGWRSDDSMLEDLGLDDPNRLEQPMLGGALQVESS